MDKMATLPPDATAYVLSLDLSVKRLRGLIVDSELDVVLADQVCFDTELSSYG